MQEDTQFFLEEVLIVTVGSPFWVDETFLVTFFVLVDAFLVEVDFFAET